jgi:hypothetical protein
LWRWIVQAPQTDRITLVCAQHVRVDAGGIATIHDGEWAYCPGGKVDNEYGHRWEAVEPATLDEVRHGHVTLVPPDAAAVPAEEAAPAITEPA